MSKVVYVVCLAVSILAMAYAVVHVSHFDCDFNKDICKSSFCVMTRTRGQMAYMSAACNISQIIPQPALRIRLLRKMGKHYTFYRVSIDQDLCEFTNVNTKDLFMNRMLSLVSKYVGNFQCPMVGNVTVNKLPLMLYLAEAMFPEGDYKVQAQVFNKDMEVLNLNISYTLTKSSLM